MRVSTPKEQQRYMAAAHAVQAGTKMKAYREHLGADRASLERYIDNRIGLNCVMAEFSAILELMIEKGVITDEEMYEAIAKGLETEKKRLEDELGRDLGAGSITLV